MILLSIDIPNEGTAFKVATNAKVKQLINATNLKRLAEVVNLSLFKLTD